MVRTQIGSTAATRLVLVRAERRASTMSATSVQQASGFGLDLPPRVFDTALGDRGCEWTATTRDRQIVRTVDVSTFTNNPTLEVAYSKDQGLPFFELTEIAGYPPSLRGPTQTFPVATSTSKLRNTRA